RPDFVDMVAETLRETGLPASCLELELTERVVMNDVEESVSRMTSFRDLGVSIAVDDFGTGYSSLSYLPRLPLNVLKIDRAFVRDLHCSSPTFPVAKAIISLAQSLGLMTIAEGIETGVELAVLRELACDVGQGYLFARPLPASEMHFGREGNRNS
ncbi:EAL domain-containing protein, partial [Deinococcus malanensis]|uniref:EAL domain-containing protein n=1 Tax=Deinococcus malanensis TaxID=1706855 RepID=UPI001663BC20